MAYGGGPDDLRGQGGGNRDSYRLPNEGLSQARYAADLQDEQKAEAEGKKPSLLERLKRWFSDAF